MESKTEIFSTDIAPTGNAMPTEKGLHCSPGQLMGSFGIAVQVLLAVVAFLCLIVKRYCEPATLRRPWIIWCYDTSKQGFGAALIHLLNVLLADYLPSQASRFYTKQTSDTDSNHSSSTTDEQVASTSESDPCSQYLLSFLLDSTIGLLIIYSLLRFVNCIVISKRFKSNSLRNGLYGYPPQWRYWMRQCGVYILIVLIEKAIILGLLCLPEVWIPVRYVFQLFPSGNSNVELIVVLLIIPLIVNAIQFWVIDNFLMKKTKSSKLKDKLSTKSKKTAKSKTSNDLNSPNSVEDHRTLDFVQIKDRVRWYGAKQSAQESAILLPNSGSGHGSDSDISNDKEPTLKWKPYINVENAPI